MSDKHKIINLIPEDSVCTFDGESAYVECGDMLITISSDTIPAEELIELGTFIQSLRDIMGDLDLELQTLMSEKSALVSTVVLLGDMLGRQLNGEVTISYNGENITNKEE